MTTRKTLALMLLMGVVCYEQPSLEKIVGVFTIAALLVGIFLAIRNKKCSC